MTSRIIVASVIAAVAHAEVIPVTSGVTLAGQSFQLPTGLSARHSILIVGFTQKGGELCGKWKKKVWPVFCTGEGSPSCYQIAVLTAVPRLLRGVVVRSIKKDMPAEEQRSFVPIFEREREWKVTAGFAEPDDAYVFVVSRTGEVEWKTHGALTEEQFARLKKQLEEP